MPSAIDIHSIKNLPLFRELTEAELTTIATLFFEKPYTQGSTLFVEGMTGEILYVIKDGSVQITKKTANNQEAVLATLKKGELLGEMSLIDNQPRTGTGRVSEESTLLVMTKKAFNTLLEKYPTIALKVMMVFLKIANERLRKANESVKQV